MGRLKNKSIAKLHRRILSITGVLFLMTTGISCYSCASDGGSSVNAQAKWAGCRSSEYGIKPFPTSSEWKTYVNKMTSYYKESTGALVWIVGGVTEYSSKHPEMSWTCHLNFPVSDAELAEIGLSKSSSSLEGIRFAEEDEYEEYFTAFDKAGYDVWLQVESGKCDLETLAKIVMNHYKKHPCVKGFGIDVEWYNPGNYKNNDGGKGTRFKGYGTQLTGEVAKKVDATVKAIKPSYNVFVKHWDPKWLPDTFPADMIFVSDSQMHESLEAMQQHFQYWAELYYPNNVFFQIGYDEDEDLWGSYKNPAKELGAYLLNGIKDPNKCGIIWVDFTLKSVL